jgi:hypothetical protein
MRAWKKGIGIAVAAVTVAWGCSDITSGGGGPLSLTVTADRQTAQVGQKLTFTYAATGQSISGITLEYGDGVVDSINSYGSQSSSGQRTHTYAEAGDYVVLGTVFDFVEGTGTASASVTVTAAPAPR